MKSLLIVSALVLVLGLPATAQDVNMDHSGMAMETDSAATMAYKAANMDMHSSMEIDYSGDADVDFVRGMIPHHQGAIAMAKIVLEHGADPEIKKLARDIIAAQETEIAWMKDWLATHPAP